MAQLKSTSVIGNLSVTGNVVASKIIKLDGTENQLLLANGETLERDTFAGSELTGQFTNLANRVQNIENGFPSSSTDNAIVRFDGSTGKIIQTSPATITDSGNMTINNVNKSDIYFEMARGTNADWRFLSSSGNLYIQNNWTTSKGDYFNVLTLNYNSGNGELKGSLTANSFKKRNGTDNDILLASGATTELDTIETGISTAQTAAANAQISADQKTTMADVQEWVKAGNYTISDNITIKSITLNNTSTPHIKMQRSTHNYLQASKDGATIALCANPTLSLNNSALVVSSSNVRPGKTNTFDLGTSSTYWKDIYASGKLTTGTIQLANTQNGTSTYDKIIMASDEGLLGYRTKREFITDLNLAYVYNYKGEIENIEALKAITSANIGDVYFISETSDSWACKQVVDEPYGSGDYYETYWSNLGNNVDLSGYMTLDTNQTITGIKTFTNNLLLTENSSSIITRSANDTWTAGIYSNSSQDEVLGILVKNPRTHIILGRGDAKTRPAAISFNGEEDGNPLPAIDIKNNKVGINKRLGTDGQDDAGNYNLDINGSLNATTIYQNEQQVLDTTNISGTSNYIPKFTATNTIGNGHIVDNDESIVLQLRTYVSDNLLPSSTNSHYLGASNYKWKEVYATTFIGSLDGNASKDGNGNVIVQHYLPKSNVSGAVDIIPKFTAANTLGESNISDDGTLITLNKITQINDILQTNASTPLFIGMNGKVGMRAKTDSINQVGQINISNSWYGAEDNNQWGAQMSAYDGTANKYNQFRVSHNGLEYLTYDTTNGEISHYSFQYNTTDKCIDVIFN